MLSLKKNTVYKMEKTYFKLKNSSFSRLIAQYTINVQSQIDKQDLENS